MVDFESTEVESDALEASSEPAADVGQESAPEPQATPQTEAPFHEHPRFKELVEQKNQYADTIKQLQNRLERFEQKMNAEPKKSDPFIEKLHGIDPELATRMDKFGQTGQTVEQLVKRLEQAEAARTQDQAKTELGRLFSENKVPTEAQRFYEADIIRMANSNPDMKLSDLPKAFKEVHDSFTKYSESLRRSDRKAYVTDKKVDAKMPTSQPKGDAAKAAKAKPPTDVEALRSDIAKVAIARNRAASDL